MRDVLAHNAKFVVDWGQPILLVLILSGIALLLLIGRKNRFFLPKGALSWAGALGALSMIAVAGLLLVVVSAEHPRTKIILEQFESMKGSMAPALSFTLLADDSVRSIDAYSGDVLLVNVWATWCPPCLEEIPAFERLQEDYRDRGVTVIALSDEPRETVGAFVAKHPSEISYGYVKMFDWAGTDLGSVRPVTFLVDRKGIIIDYYTGAYTYDEYVEKIQPLLNE